MAELAGRLRVLRRPRRCLDSGVPRRALCESNGRADSNADTVACDAWSPWHRGRMNPKTLRVFVYDWLLARGAPPSSAVIAAHFGTSVDDTRALLGELKIGKTIYPHACSGEIWMAGAFSAVPTPYRVTGSRAAWWANCAWDMLGVAVIAND